jgi:hypothetical protein
MLTLPSSLRVFAKTGPTDMRRSFEGLVGLVERELHQQVESGDLFLLYSDNYFSGLTTIRIPG